MWLGGIIGFFAIQALIWIAAITYTHRDLSHAVLPDYDTRALEWDDYQARWTASRKLGWQAALTLEPVENRRGQVRLRLQLTDPLAQPVLTDGVDVEFFHCARAAQRGQARLVGDGTGQYAAILPLDRVGTWQFEIRTERGAEQFLDRQRIEVVESVLNQPKRQYLDPRRMP